MIISYKIMAIKEFQWDFYSRNSLTYLGLEIYYRWFCYTAFVLAYLSGNPVLAGSMTQGDLFRILSSYNLCKRSCSIGTEPPVS